MQGGHYPYVYVDGIYLRRNWGGEYENVAVLVAIAVNEDGFREVLGAAEGMKEDKASWVSFFQWLRGRGLDGVKLIVGDKCMRYHRFTSIPMSVRRMRHRAKSPISSNLSRTSTISLIRNSGISSAEKSVHIRCLWPNSQVDWKGSFRREGSERRHVRRGCGIREKSEDRQYPPSSFPDTCICAFRGAHHASPGRKILIIGAIVCSFSVLIPSDRVSPSGCAIVTLPL